ncbi:MAG: GNAT family N-acetyltransferase [Bacteroidales bacterium]
MTDQRPTILTQRLCLRPFLLSDAAEVQHMAGDERVAATTLNLPHPYPYGLANEWIASHQNNFLIRKSLILAICLRMEEQLIGAIGLTMKQELENAELGYWIAAGHWNKGYATEAAYSISKYGFEYLHLHKIFAHYFTGNDASGRVMQKIGMKEEGYLRQHVKHLGNFKDLHLYGLLHTDLVQPAFTHVEILP